MIAWHNGRFCDESEVLLSFRDSVAMYGEGVYDTSRTFEGRLFRLREHLERLWQSLAYVRLYPGLSLDELAEVSEELCRTNWAGEDFWLSQRVTRGVPGGPPTVIVECTPIPFDVRAPYYRDGARIRTSTHRRMPPWAQSPRAKTMSLLNLRLAGEVVRARELEAFRTMSAFFVHDLKNTASTLSLMLRRVLCVLSITSITLPIQSNARKQGHGGRVGL